ncbi:uncharacterized protein LOC131582051 [Poecile atricapillus]|uniref:uncharacterized protein LOC131582051 n=1 Tax=Poecile atricapillus TaxID=48891 RepID=UPI00273973C5|nr:uncharacterized protein LOC131582051 [Poecile atricapillus]
MKSQQALGSQQAEVTTGSEVTEVPEPCSCTTPQGRSSQSLTTTVAAAAATAAAAAAVVLTFEQRCQDSGGSKSCRTGRGQGIMALALRFFLLLLLAAALPDRAAQAAPQRAWRAGPPTWTNQNIEDEKSLEASRLLDKMLSDLETRREMKKMALLKAVFPEGNSGTWAASAEGREAIPGTVPGDEGAETASPAAGMEDGLEPLGGSAGKFSTSAQSIIIDNLPRNR